MKKNRMMKRISAFIVLAMMVTGIPVYAMELPDTQDALQDAVIADEAAAVIDDVDEAAGQENVLFDAEDPEVKDAAIDAAALDDDVISGSSDNEDVSRDGDNNAYNIIYTLEDVATLSSDAQERIAKVRNDKIRFDDNNVVNQSFEKDDTDKLAPLVYVHNEGKKARGLRTWYAKKTSDTYIGEFTYGMASEYGYINEAHNAMPGYRVVPCIVIDDGILSDGVRVYSIGGSTTKSYLAANATVSEAQVHASGTTIRLYPNWQTPIEVIFDEESLKGARNVNSWMVDYVPYEILELEPLANIPRYEFKGWKYKFEGDTDLQDAVPGTGEQEGKFLIDVGTNTRKLTIYAEWEPEKYKITYKGIKIQPVSGDSVPVDSSFMLDGTQMEVVPDKEPILIVSGNVLPSIYNCEETLVLPTAGEVAALDKSFGENNVFIAWSKSRKFRKDVKKLGKGGDIEYGDVTLYVIYTSKYPTPTTPVNDAWRDNKFTATQVTVPDLLDKDDYAVIAIKGTCASADQGGIILGKGSSEYFELHQEDARKVGLGHGDAAVAIKLKDNVDYATALNIKNTSKLRKLILRVPTVGGETDKDRNPIYTDIPVTLKVKLKLPKYKLTETKGVIYKQCVDEGEVVELVTSEKTGALKLESYGGDWVADYVVKNNNNYNVRDDVNVSLDGNDFTISTSKEVRGYIRLRNTDWLEGAYVYLSYKIKENTKKSIIKVLPGTIVLNSRVDGETGSAVIRFKNGMKVDGSCVTLDTSKVPAGISVEQKDGIITATRTGEVKTGTYKVGFYYNNKIDMTVRNTLTIKIMSTEPEKAVKMNVKGKIDALMGGSLFLTPKVTGYAGSIEDVRVDSGDKTPEFETLWSGGTVELMTNYDYKPCADSREIKLIVTMSTGLELPYTLKFKPEKGQFKLMVYDAVVKVPEKEGEPASGAFTPVIATYTYKYYTSPNTYVSKCYTIDLTTDNGKLVTVSPPENKDNDVTASYENGVITLTGKGIYKKDKSITLKIGAKFNCTGKTYNRSYKVNIRKADQ